MNPYVVEVVCDVCGEGGMCRPRDAAAQWYGEGLRHTDPEVCARNLRRQRKRLEAEKAKLHEATAPNF